MPLGGFCEGFQLRRRSLRRTRGRRWWRQLDEAGDKTEEATPVAGCDVGVESAGVVPSTESKGVALGVSADHDDEGEEDETDCEEDFSEGQPVLRFAVEFDCEEVDTEIND